MLFLFKENDKRIQNGPQFVVLLYRNMLRLPRFSPASVSVTLWRAAWLLEWVFDQQEIIRPHGRSTWHGVPLSLFDKLKAHLLLTLTI